MDRKNRRAESNDKHRAAVKSLPSVIHPFVPSNPSTGVSGGVWERGNIWPFVGSTHQTLSAVSWTDFGFVLSRRLQQMYGGSK